MEKGNFNNEYVQSSRDFEKNLTSIQFPAQQTMENPSNNYNVERSYCEMLQKNKPQSNSVLGGFSLLILSGLHIGWGIWRINYREPWYTFTNYNLIIFITMSWYVFAIVGGIIGAVLVTNMRKKYIYYLGGTMFGVSSVLFIVWYDNYIAIIIGRSLAGLSHGIIYNASITHAAENVVKEIRGMLLSSVNLTIFSGVFVSAIFISTVTYREYTYTFSSDRLFGIIGLIFSFFGIVCTIFLTYESVPFLLRRSNDTEAVVNMLKLRNESVMTTKISNELDEIKLMVAQDKLDSGNIFADRNAPALSKMIALRILANLSHNFLLNIIMMSLTATLLEPNYEYAPVVLTAVRFLASLIPLYSLDFFSRKSHLTVSGFGCGILALVLAILAVSNVQFRRDTYWIPAVLCILFQVFAALGIDPMQHIMTSEAFSTSKKAWSIAYVTGAECLSQILLIGVYFIDGITFIGLVTILFVTAGSIMLLTLLLQFTLPETLRTTMKEARDLFRK